MPKFPFHQEVVNAIHDHAKREYPAECCGWVLTVGGQQVYKESKNLQDKYHKFDPENYPRTSKDAFLPEMHKLQADLDGLTDNDSLYSIVHSHIDVGAYFSDEDKLQMSDPEHKQPIYNAENYLVVSVNKGEIAEHAVFYFDADKEDYLAGEFSVGE